MNTLVGVVLQAVNYVLTFKRFFSQSLFCIDKRHIQCIIVEQS
jgi:hypothetical protein